MTLHAPTWHNLGALVAALCLAGCFEAHGPRGAGPAPGPAPGLDAGSVDARATGSADASALDVTFVPLRDAGDACAQLLATLRVGLAPEEIECDVWTFPRDCTEPVNPCCTLQLACVADHPGARGHVATILACDGWCAQGCSTYDDEDCAIVPGCEWFAPGACGPAPDGFVEGPACIDARGATCVSDAECPDRQRCRAYWINPCAGLPCDACGGEERRCSL
jgi:hypothetical protein